MDVSKIYEVLRELPFHLSGLTCADHGDCVSLKPSSIDKKVGIEWLDELYRKFDNPIDFSNSLWMGDGVSDIPAARFILERGGSIAAVANSHDDYRNFILEHGGYLSKEKYTKGAIDILKHFF